MPDPDPTPATKLDTDPVSAMASGAASAQPPADPDPEPGAGPADAPGGTSADTPNAEGTAPVGEEELFASLEALEAGHAATGGPALPAPAEYSQTPDELMASFFSELKAVDRSNEVDRILWAFKLNPFEQLNLRFDSPPEATPRAYRKLSLMVHPDKCAHPRAKDAFDVLKAAQEKLLDEKQREGLCRVLDWVRDGLREQRRKDTKHDASLRIASLIEEDGKEGLQAKYEATEEFHEQWKLKSRDVLARGEFRRRRVAKRMKTEEARVEEEIKNDKEEAKAKRAHDKAFEKGRDGRVNSWRDFASGKKKAKKDKGEKKLRGMMKVPKMRMETRPQKP